MKSFKLKLSVLITLCLICCNIFTTFAQAMAAVRANSAFNQMNFAEILDVTIKADISAIKENRNKATYFKGTLEFEDAAGLPVVHEIEMRARGKFRRMRCDFPPIKVKFEEKGLESKGLKNFQNLKLVTHCDDRAHSEQSILKEYQAYKLYSQLSAYSFRVQLLRIHYIDEGGDDFTRYGFFIESYKELSDRLEVEKVKVLNISKDQVNKEHLDLVSVYQFMIGNSDWNIIILKNVKLVKPKHSDKVIPVPYDFDFSGLVNAHYAIPCPDYPISSVRDRIYLGSDCKDKSLLPTLEKIEAKKLGLLDTCETFKLMKKGHRKAMTRYLNNFYKIMYQQEKWTSL